MLTPEDDGCRGEIVDMMPEWAWNEAEAIPPECTTTELHVSLGFRRSCMFKRPLELRHNMVS
jgi:hypothetical protein